MIMTDPKKTITTIMDRRRGKDGIERESTMVPSIAKTEDTEMDPKHEAAKDILNAIQEKHPQKLSEALSAHHDLHLMHKES